MNPDQSTITRAQARKLVEQALRSQEDPGEYTPQQMFGGQYEDNTQWKARALELVIWRMFDEPPKCGCQDAFGDDLNVTVSGITDHTAPGNYLFGSEAVDQLRAALEYARVFLPSKMIDDALSLLPVTPRQAP